MIGAGARWYRTNLTWGSLAAIVVLGVYGGMRVLASSLVDRPLLSVGIDFAGLILATTVALPWFRLALDSEDGDGGPRPTFRLPFGAMFGGSFLFWAGIFLGFRYLAGIPSIFVLVWYGVFGYAIADGRRSGVRALGDSVRLGQGNRAIVALMGFLLLSLNLLGAVSLGVNASPGSVAVAFVGLMITTNISMGAGAQLYRALTRARDPGPVS